jgi:ubiquinone/menaquinone biosynthesis C-methylase UbiE
MGHPSNERGPILLGGRRVLRQAVLKMGFQKESDDVSSFERRSSNYEHSYHQGLFFDRIHRAALGSVPPGAQPDCILDVGCGTGRLLRKAAVRWPKARLLGVDPAEGMIAEARRLTPGAGFQVSPAESLPLADRTIALAFSTVSFHHWQDQLQGVKQVARVLRPAGFFVLVDLCLPFGLKRIFIHGRQADPAEVRAMFARADLNVLAQRRVMTRFLLVTVGQRMLDPLTTGIQPSEKRPG